MNKKKRDPSYKFSLFRLSIAGVVVFTLLIFSVPRTSLHAQVSLPPSFSFAALHKKISHVSVMIQSPLERVTAAAVVASKHFYHTFVKDGVDHMVDTLGAISCNVLYQNCISAPTFQITLHTAPPPTPRVVLATPIPSPAPHAVTQNQTVQSKTSVREVVERKEIIVPSDVTKIRQLITDSFSNTQAAVSTALQTLEANINDVRQRLVSVTAQADGHTRDIQLTQKIDELERLKIVNGMRVRSGGIDIDNGGVDIAIGGVTADTFVARKAINLTGGTSTLANLIVNGLVGIGTTSPSEELAIAGELFVGSTGTSTFTNGITLTAGCFRMPDGSCITPAGATLNSGTINRLAYYSSATNVNAADFLSVDASNTRFGIGTS